MSRETRLVSIVSIIVAVLVAILSVVLPPIQPDQLRALPIVVVVL
jgi:Na+-transporting NADH:ubiquinone oxidoreductase subunit NqrC